MRTGVAISCNNTATVWPIGPLVVGSILERIFLQFTALTAAIRFSVGVFDFRPKALSDFAGSDLLFSGLVFTQTSGSLQLDIPLWVRIDRPVYPGLLMDGIGLASATGNAFWQVRPPMHPAARY